MNAAQHILVVGVKLYRAVLSPMKLAVFGPLGRCRYWPSCSEFALEAVRLHGAGRGLWLSLKRISRCHPWGGCGYDPVPAVSSGCPAANPEPNAPCPAHGHEKPPAQPRASFGHC